MLNLMLDRFLLTSCWNARTLWTIVAFYWRMIMFFIFEVIWWWLLLEAMWYQALWVLCIFLLVSWVDFLKLLLGWCLLRNIQVYHGFLWGWLLWLEVLSPIRLIAMRRHIWGSYKLLCMIIVGNIILGVSNHDSMRILLMMIVMTLSFVLFRFLNRFLLRLL